MQDQLDLLSVWGPFAWLGRSLRVLLSNYINVVTAHRITRYVISDLFKDAARARICPSGVYDAALSYAAEYLAQELNVMGVHSYDLKDHDFEVPSVNRLESLCKAYAMIYECGYHGQWQYDEIMMMQAHLRVYDILEVSESTLHQYVDLGDESLDPIRRALVNIEHHDWGNEVSCVVASDLRDSLVTRSTAWHRDVTA